MPQCEKYFARSDSILIGGVSIFATLWLMFGLKGIHSPKLSAVINGRIAALNFGAHVSNHSC